MNGGERNEDMLFRGRVHVRPSPFHYLGYGGFFLSGDSFCSVSSSVRGFLQARAIFNCYLVFHGESRKDICFYEA